MNVLFSLLVCSGVLIRLRSASSERTVQCSAASQRRDELTDKNERMFEHKPVDPVSPVKQKL